MMFICVENLILSALLTACLLAWVNSMSDEERQEKVWNYWMEKVKREGGIKSPIADYLSRKGA